MYFKKEDIIYDLMEYCKLSNIPGLLFDGDMHRGEQLSFSVNIGSCYSEQMDVPEYIERYATNCVLEQDRFGGIKVMVTGIRGDSP